MKGSSQTIFRIASEDEPYTRLPNAIVQDATLTPEAFSVLAFMLSLPSDWRFNVAHVARMRRMGRDRAYRAVSELIERGFCRRDDDRDAGGRSKGCNYLFTDVPGRFEVPAAPVPEDQEPARIEPLPEDQKPAPAEPLPEDQEAAHVAPLPGVPLPEPLETEHQDTYKGPSVDKHPNRTKAPSPVEFVAGGGERLIPTAMTDPVEITKDALAEPGSRRVDQRCTGPRRFEFSLATIVKVRSMGVNPAVLIARFDAMGGRIANGEPIEKPDAWLLACAKNERSALDGVAVGTIKALAQPVARPAAKPAAPAVADGPDKVGDVLGALDRFRAARFGDALVGGDA